MTVMRSGAPIEFHILSERGAPTGVVHNYSVASPTISTPKVVSARVAGERLFLAYLTDNGTYFQRVNIPFSLGDAVGFGEALLGGPEIISCHNCFQAVMLDGVSWFFGGTRNGALVVGEEQMTRLDGKFHFTASGNSEITHDWLLHVIRAGYEPGMEKLEAFLTGQGRRKFLQPLYEELSKSKKGKIVANRIYAQARPGYHAVSRQTIDQILGVAQDKQ